MPVKLLSLATSAVLKEDSLEAFDIKQSSFFQPYFQPTRIIGTRRAVSKLISNRMSYKNLIKENKPDSNNFASGYSFGWFGPCRGCIRGGTALTRQFISQGKRCRTGACQSYCAGIGLRRCWARLASLFGRPQDHC